MGVFNIQALPLELEEAIWYQALPAPRVLWLCSTRGHDWQWYASHEPTPTLMHVCAHSRRVCLRVYRKLGTPRPVYINYNRDIVLIHTRYSKLMHSSILHATHEVGLQADLVRHVGFMESGWHSHLSRFSTTRFSTLETLTIFLCDQVGKETEIVEATGLTGPTLNGVLRPPSSDELGVVIKNYLAYTQWLQTCQGSYAEHYASVWATMDRLTIRYGRQRRHHSAPPTSPTAVQMSQMSPICRSGLAAQT